MQLGRFAERLSPLLYVYWHYKQWRDAGVFDQLMAILHGQVRTRVKKSRWTTLIIIVPVAVRWVIERSNAWVERCKNLVKNFEWTLEHARSKLWLGFIRLMVKRLAT